MIFQDLLLELMLQNEALAKIESVNLQALEVLKSSAEVQDAEVLRPEIVIENDDARIVASSEDLVPTEDESRASTSQASPNYTEELISIGLDQVRTLEFILTEVKNGNSRMASVSDAIQQLTNVVSELEQSGTERLAAEEARREIPKDGLSEKLATPAPKKEDGSLFGKILGGLAIIGTLVAGFVNGIVATVTKVFSSVTSFFTKNFPKIFTTVKTFFVDLGTKISAFFKESKVFDGIRKVFSGTGSIFAKIGGFFGQIGTFLSEAWAAISGKFPMLSKIGSIGKILGKLALPLTAIFGIFDGVKAGIEEFQKTGDLGKAFGEGVKGLVTSIVGAPLDLLKSAVSWVLGKLGFSEAEGFLDSFSFSDLIGVFIQRVIDWGKGIFETFFSTIYDVFTDISAGFEKGPLEGMLEILRGVLKTLIASPLDMVKNTIAAAAGFVGASSVEDYLRGISFTKMLGGTHTETSAEKKTSGKSIAEEAGEVTSAKKLAKEQKKVDEHIAEQDRILKEQETKTEKKKGILESIQNPITVFYDSLIKAYQENSSGVDSQGLQAVPSTIGAEISAMESDTADMEAEAQMSGPATVVAPQSRTVNNSNQSVTYNSNNIPDRTTWMTTPLSSWAGI